MRYVTHLRCMICGDTYAPSQVEYVCPKHGYEGILDVAYDYDLIRPQLTKERLAANPDRSIWRYTPLLPVEREESAPPLQVGWTPLYHAQRLGAKLGLTNLYLKDDGRNPTASFKDRASAIAVTKARETGREMITAASTGNAASSLAGLAASVGIKTVIFVPETTPKPKVAQLLIFGARVIMVRGTYDEAFDLCLAASEEYGWYNRNTAYNPYLSEGKKTAALEVCEQLGWDAPDKILVPVGDGCIIGGIWKGLHDLLQLGLIRHMPQIIGVQAEGSAALANAWSAGSQRVTPVKPATLADSISVGQPRDAIKALRAVYESDGIYVTVSDEEILAAMRTLARGAGVFGEPAGVTGFAGLEKMVRKGLVDPDEHVVVLITGSGLKDVDSAIRATHSPALIEPSLSALRELLARSP